MKLENVTSVFNMGDTSFRRKTLLDDYKELLPILKKHKENYPQWDRNNEAQGIFYNEVMDKTELFDRSVSEDSAKRGRTLTNGLIKPGLVNAYRELGESAVHWISGDSKSSDSLEELLTLSIDNLVFLRQWFKLRVYDVKGQNYFYPFRVALEFLSRYKDIPENDLFIILHSIDPNMSNSDIYTVIDNYKNVVDNQQIFEEYIEINLPAIKNEEDIQKAKKIFQHPKESKESFNLLFPNRKSSKTQKLYYDFYSAVFDYRNKRTQENLENMIDVSRKNAIKKAFGFRSLPFNIPRKTNLSVQEFETANVGNLILNSDESKFLSLFVNSKRADLIKEYSDMTKRSFNLSGIFSFESGLINLVHPWLITRIMNLLSTKEELVGKGSYSEYEIKIDSDFYRDLSLVEILNLADSEVGQIKEEIRKSFNIDDILSLTKVFEDEKEKRFRAVIEKEFTREKTIELLGFFINRTPKNDRKIKKTVSDSATIPTIFEYVLAIAWYHLSDKNYSIRKSLNLSLDGNFKPLTHAAGGDGDIIISKQSMTLMLEATLMNKNAQKRGELEPVIRHATNLATRECKKVITIFVADELDTNVINIFRGVSAIELESTQERGKTIKGVKIFSMKITEIIALIEKNVPESKVIQTIDDSFESSSFGVDVGWRDEVVLKLGI